MADYRLSVKVVSRSTGRSAVAAAAYRAGEQLQDGRTGEIHDYTRRGGVEHVEIRAPKNAPAWTQNREKLWTEAEKAEKRINSQTAREIQISLPHELNAEQRKELVNQWVDQQLVGRGMVADIAIHAPSKGGDQRNFHAHILLTTRDISGEKFTEKNREWNSKSVLSEWRESWAKAQNIALEKALGKDAPKVTHESYVDRGIEKFPTKHLGPAQSARERQGKETWKGNYNRGAKTANDKMTAARGKARATQRTLAPHEVRSIDGVMAELALRAKTQREKLIEAKTKIDHAVIEGKKANREGFVAVRNEVIGTSYADMKAAEKAARSAEYRASKTSIRSELMGIIHSPTKHLIRKAERVFAAMEARAKAELARKEYQQRKEFLSSKEAQKFVSEKVRNSTENSVNWRSEERKFRREYARLSREGEKIDKSFRAAQIIKNAGINDVKMTAKKVTEAGYSQEVMGDIAATLKRMTPAQWDKARAATRARQQGQEQGR